MSLKEPLASERGTIMMKWKKTLSSFICLTVLFHAIHYVAEMSYHTMCCPINKPTGIFTCLYNYGNVMCYYAHYVAHLSRTNVVSKIFSPVFQILF